ncbi:copper resistance CopC family protein [Herbidospora sp. NBRC 101105]|uniref:copper resistance CopC family protein n=1 Tax=Herbidospora sp. NBRC 101105 TaxID=3032195 RepID=UPI0024A4C989|nr:copper resistance CopC family protein [Herbidospora sp. NBRC 101105]GLX99074.1 copper resistance protein CopC [Herbidospora sp. NBRC 101105]
MRLLGLVAGVIATLLLAAAPALAHDQLKASDPARDATVGSLEAITLTFSSQVRFPAMVLHDAAGAAVELTEPEVRGKDLTARPLSAPAPGRYVIGWRVVSSDGHPIEGEIPFTLASPTGGDTPLAAAPAASASAEAVPPPVASSAPSARPVSASETDSGGGYLWFVGALIALVGVGFVVAMGGRRKRGAGDSQ